MSSSLCRLLASLHHPGVRKRHSSAMPSVLWYLLLQTILDVLNNFARLPCKNCYQSCQGYSLFWPPSPSQIQPGMYSFSINSSQSKVIPPLQTQFVIVVPAHLLVYRSRGFAFWCRCHCRWCRFLDHTGRRRTRTKFSQFGW